MTEYRVVRTDYYVLDVEADTPEAALELCDTEDEYLNDGDFSHSNFEIPDEDITSEYDPETKELKILPASKEKTITKDMLINALRKLEDQERFGHPRKERITLAKYYYPDIDSGVELEACNDDEECINQLWEAL